MREELTDERIKQFLAPWLISPGDEQDERDLIASVRAMLAEPSPQDGGIPPYPKGVVVGPCVCGSWPGGECLKCRVQRVEVG